MDHDTFHSWLDAYGRTWEEQDPQATAALYTENVAYYEIPFDEPVRGREGILRYAAEAAAAQKNVRFRAEVLAFEGDTGIAHWKSSFDRVPSGIHVELEGVFLVTFGEAGLCREFHEWWHRRESDPQA